jgi:hypothetical protein
MPLFEKHFTLEEACGELPWLREQLTRVRALIAGLRQVQVEMERIVALVSSNGTGSKHPEYGETVKELQDIVTEIGARGIQIKDLEQGLVDFPHMRNGDEVYLCYLYGEETIEYWHTIEGGFAGRAPL